MASFGEIVREQRSELGMTQARLAELVGETTSAVRTWEREQAIPGDPDTLRTLSVVLGVDLDILLVPAREAGYVEAPVEVSPGVRLLGTGSSADAVRVAREPEDDPTAEITQLTETPDHGAEHATTSVVEELDEPEEADVWSTDVTVAPEQAPTPTATSQAPVQVTASRPTPRRKGTERPVAVGNYLDDPRELRRYQLRALYTLAAVIAMLIIARYALGEVGESVSTMWTSFTENFRF